MTEEEKYKAVNERAFDYLANQLETLEKRYGDLEYEIELLGEMYAIMIVVSMMGYYPVRMAGDAEQSANNIIKMAAGEGEGNDKD